MVNKFEAFGIAGSIGLMVLALWLLRVETTNDSFVFLNAENQAATVYTANDADFRSALSAAYDEASNEDGTLAKMIVDDVRIGTGDVVEVGDVISVHYIGSLTNGQQFDNSYNRGEPFTFEVGAGRVIKGWDQGVVGMQAGGERVLVIPPHMGYGTDGYGPIPGNASLVFVIELVSINE